MTAVLATLSWQGIGLRVAVVAGALVIWFWTQSLIGSKSPATPEGGIGDAVHMWTAGWNAWLHDHSAANNALLIASSACIDALSLFIIGATIFGKSIRPVLGLILIFSLRQINQAFTKTLDTLGVEIRGGRKERVVCTADIDAAWSRLPLVNASSARANDDELVASLIEGGR